MSRLLTRAVLGGALALLGLGLGAVPTLPAAPDAAMSIADAPGAQVCFWSEYGLACVERGVTSAADGDRRGQARALLDVLLTGPTAAELAQGLVSAIPAGTRLASVDCQRLADGREPGLSCGQVRVRLEWPAENLGRLDDAAVEAAVRQAGATLEPVGWRDLLLEALDPQTGEYQPLSAFLPSLSVPRKEAGPTDDAAALAAAGTEGADVAAQAGQPPAYGQGQPQGALTGKTIYISAGHGWLWSEAYGWRAQRPPYPNAPYPGPVIEDHNNAEAVNQVLLQYLWNAGADVWPVRERDRRGFDTIVNNDAPGAGNSYSETGAWTLSGSPGYDLDQPGHTYRFTLVGSQPTATATWTVAVPTDGEYAVYVWYRHGDNRASDARYTVYHAGGQTVVRVDQTRHGQTWRHIGSFSFRASAGARITLDNASSGINKVVIADAVRLGGGTFDSLAGIDTAVAFPASSLLSGELIGLGVNAIYPPNKPWWEVATFFYAQRQGLDPTTLARYNDVIARPIYARWEHAGTGDDALFISWHSNGISGYQTTTRGTVSYVYSGTPTEGSLALQAAVHQQLVGDLRAAWDPTWVDLGMRRLDLGEVRELWDADPSVRMPGVLLEVAYHDHPGDTDALKDPRFNVIAARAVYRGIVRYFAERDGNPVVVLPEPPTHLRLANAGGGQVLARWNAPPVGGAAGGGAATGYRVYTSADGLGWSNGVAAAGTSYTLSGLAPGQLVFVRVSAVNAGGESFPTETLGARVGDDPTLLLVNGFDRTDRFGTVTDNDPVMGANQRLWLNRMNRYNYAVHHGSAIAIPFNSAANEAVADGLTRLGRYRMVDWILGEESSADETLSAAERTALTGYLNGGGALFISGTELGWDLVYQGRAPAFYRDYLGADYAGDDAATRQVTPASGGIFAGLSAFRFDAPGEYDADYPDQLSPYGGSRAALTYVGGAGGTAAIQSAQGCRRVVTFGFPFETIRPEARAAVMARIIDYLDECTNHSTFVPLVARDAW
ncbi:MAG: hypothetical protein GX601_03990 [Anaerolineales bacterium]|nr:hypothetical protein [Anaerolineales bacterium]